MGWLAAFLMVALFWWPLLLFILLAVGIVVVTRLFFRVRHPDYLGNARSSRPADGGIEINDFSVSDASPHDSQESETHSALPPDDSSQS